MSQQEEKIDLQEKELNKLAMTLALSFDLLRKIEIETEEEQMLIALSEQVQGLQRFVKIKNFYNEIYLIGKTLSYNQFNMANKMRLMEIEMQDLKTEIESLKAW